MRWHFLVTSAKTNQLIFFDVKVNQERDEPRIPDEIMKKAEALGNELNEWRKNYANRKD